MKREKLKLSTILSYALATGSGYQIMGSLVGAYLMIFLTDTFGVPAGAVGVITVVASVWDAINDPMMGTIADRTKSRWGKYRPYFLFIPAIVIGGQMAGAIGVTLGFLLVQIINTILSYFVMIKPVLGSSYRQYILSLWLPFYLSLPTLVVSSALGIVLKGQLALGMLLAVQIAAGVLAFVVMIVLSRHPLVVEVKRQFCRSEKMKMLLRVG